MSQRKWSVEVWGWRPMINTPNKQSKSSWKLKQNLTTHEGIFSNQIHYSTLPTLPTTIENWKLIWVVSFKCITRDSYIIKDQSTHAPSGAKLWSPFGFFGQINFTTAQCEHNHCWRPYKYISPWTLWQFPPSKVTEMYQLHKEQEVLFFLGISHSLVRQNICKASSYTVKEFLQNV